MEFFTNICTMTRWWPENTRRVVGSVFYLLLCLCLIAPETVCTHGEHALALSDIGEIKFTNSELHIQYSGKDSKISDVKITGRYSKGSKVNYSPVKGRIVKVRTASDQNENGCETIDPNIIPPSGAWIALIKRGECDFDDKVFFSAKRSNATAVVIYDNKENEDNTYVASSNYSDVITVMVEKEYGKQLLNYVENHKNVNMTISVARATVYPTTANPNNGEAFSANNTSVLFVSISFIVLIIISLAWLVFYYIQRCRYTNAKERLSRRLANAAKKAISKIPQRSVKYGDKELESEAEQCAVCIEPYKISDVIRVLPCRHVFHKSCVDPWLLEQRSCPMCKMDILRAYGMHLNGSQESVPQDGESGLMSSSPALEEVERLSNSEEQGAVGGVKIVLYQHPSVHRYRDSGSAHFHDSELSSEGSLDLGSSPVAQCHVEYTTSQVVLESSGSSAVKPGTSSSSSEPSLHAQSPSLESEHDSDDECNEIDSLISGLPKSSRGSGTASLNTSTKSLRKSSTSSSITNSIKDSTEH